MKYLLGSALAVLMLAPLTATSASAHGCHRDIEEGRAGLHRHVGRDCERIEARRRYEGRREERYEERRRAPVCTKQCQYIGPIKTCDTICR